MLKTIEDFCAAYEQFNCSDLDWVAQLYDENIEFIDPIHRISGRRDLVSYFEAACRSLSKCNFVFSSKIIDGDTAALEWQMIFSHPNIAKGEIKQLSGASIVRFADGKAVYHRDYYDVGEMVYDHLPFIGWIVKKIKKRIAAGA